MAERSGGPAEGDAPARRARVLDLGRGRSVDLGEISWRFLAAGGPGGQHANRNATRVEARFDVAGSPSLSEADRARLIERLGPVVRAVAGDERSQYRNRVVATERLRKRLAEALRPVAKRHPTAPSAAARQRRMDEKRRTAERKRGRSGPIDWS